MCNFVDRAFISDQLSNLFQAIKISQRNLPVMSIFINTTIAGNQAQNPSHFGRPLVKELLVKKVGAAYAGFHTVIIGLALSLKFATGLKDKTAQLRAPAAKVAGDLFHAFIGTPVTEVELLKRNGISGGKKRTSIWLIKMAGFLGSVLTHVVHVAHATLGCWLQTIWDNANLVVGHINHSYARSIPHPKELVKWA